MTEEQESDTPNKSSWYKTWWGIVIIVFGVLVIFGAAIGDEGENTTQPQQTEDSKATPTKTVSETITVSFEKLTEDDDNLVQGQTQVAQEGINGVTELTFEVSGSERTKIAEKVLTAPQDEITRVGTKVQPIELSGSGQQASQKFTLGEGLSIFRMTHSGQSNFIIGLLDSSGQRIEGLVNEIGPFEGSQALGIDTPGEFVLDVQAGGNWNVKIDQPRPTSAPATPKTLSGRGQQASEFIEIDSGLTTFKMTHSGQSNFIVSLLDSDGQRVEGLVNEIGPFDGSKATGISSSGIYILDIQADGDWSIAID